MLAPSIAVILLVAAYPIGYAIWLSLHEYSLIHKGLSRWAGFRNYSSALWGDESHAFWNAFRTTFIVGFPGESDSDVDDLYGFVDDHEFDHEIGRASCRERV